MNLEFQDPFSSTFPKTIEKTIKDLNCLCGAFSKNGNFFIAACSDNTIIVYDTVLYSRVAELYSDGLPRSKIQSVSVSRKSNLIAILFATNDLVVWNGMTKKVIFKSDPCDDKICFVKYLWGPSELYNFTAKDVLFVVRESGLIQISCDSSKLELFYFLPTSGRIIAADISKTHLFLVDSVCPLHVVSLITRDVVGSFSESELLLNESTTASTSCISSLSCHYQRNEIVISCKNRSIRVLKYHADSGILDIKLKLMDPVNKRPWKFGGQSHHLEFDSSITFGVASVKGTHSVYMWENGSGSLLKCLDGPKEEISLALWHPMKPQLLTVGSSTGQIYIWGPDFQQKWSALVPNIEAIETNIEYIERESEFDLPAVGVFEGRKDKNLEEIKILFENFSKKSQIKEIKNLHLHSDEDDDLNFIYPLDI